MKVRSYGGVLMALIVALAVTGCGGGGSSSTTATATVPPKRLSRAAFIKQANALCLKAEKARGRVVEAAAQRYPQGSKVTQEDQEVVIESALVPYKKLVAQFEAIGAPKGDSRQVKAIVVALASGVHSVQRNPGAAVSSDSQFSRFNRLAIKYGLSSCQV